MTEENSSDLNNPSHRPKFVSEYSMGNFDFERYNQWLKFIETWSSEINSVHIPTLDMIQHLYSGLNIIYDNWRPIISTPKIVTDIDNKFEEIKNKKRIWERNIRIGTSPSDTFIHNITDSLMEIKRKIMDMKQIIGLGIVVKRNMTTRDKIKAGMSKDKFTNLPVA